MTEEQKEKNSNLSPKHFTFLFSFPLTSAYKPQPMKINIFLEDFRYDPLPPNDCFNESQSKESYFFRVPRVLPGDPPLTEEPENSGLEISRHKCLIRHSLGSSRMTSQNSVPVGYSFIELRSAWPMSHESRMKSL